MGNAGSYPAHDSDSDSVDEDPRRSDLQSPQARAERITVAEPGVSSDDLEIEERCCEAMLDTVRMGMQRIVLIGDRVFAVHTVSSHNVTGVVELHGIDRKTVQMIHAENTQLHDASLPVCEEPTTTRRSANYLQSVAVHSMRHGGDVNVLADTRHLAPYVQ